jgi:hypothetical protein
LSRARRAANEAIVDVRRVAKAAGAQGRAPGYRESEADEAIEERRFLDLTPLRGRRW